jgi:hypothetical protein
MKGDMKHRYKFVFIGILILNLKNFLTLKKLLLLIPILILYLSSVGQSTNPYTNKSTRGAFGTLDSSKGPITSGTGIINKTYADTTAANADGKLKTYIGAQIATIDGKVWVSNGVRWIEIGTGGSGGTTVTFYGKNATNDSTILLLSDGTRYAAVDNTGNGSLFCHGLLAGGIVTWDSLLVFDVSAAVYCINNFQYSSAWDSIVLDVADPTYPRRDVIALDTNGNVVKITGVAAADPAVPQVDPLSQYYLTDVLIAAGDSVPQGVGSVVLWNENTGSPEYTGSYGGAVTDFDNLLFPYIGLKSTKVGAFTGVAKVGVVYTGTGYSTTIYNSLKMFIRLNSTLAASANIYVTLMSGGANVTAGLLLGSLQGFSKSNTLSYQNITAQFNDFAWLSDPATIDGVKITSIGANTQGFYIDYITLNGGTSNGSSNYVTSVFARNDSLFYEKNGVATFFYKVDTVATNAITQLIGDVTAIGPGISVATLDTSSSNSRLQAFVRGVVHDSTLVIAEGTNINFTGAGTQASPLLINATAGSSDSTLQQVFNKSVEAGDNPTITGGGNALGIDDLSSFYIYSQAPNYLSGISGAPSNVTIESHGDSTESTIGVIGEELGKSVIKIESTKDGAVTNTNHKIFVYNDEIKIIGNTDAVPRTKLIINGVDTLLTPPAYIWAADGDTLKKVAYPTGGGSGGKSLINDNATIVVDSVSTPGLYKIKVDTVTTVAGKDYTNNKLGLKVNISDTTAQTANYRDSIAAHNLRIIGKEPLLGNPSVSGYVLSSTTAGVRSWVAQSGIYNWQRKGAILNATTTADLDNVFEPTVIREASPQILTQYDTVYKMWYTAGWATFGINYAESVDGVTWSKYTSNPVVASHARSYVLKNGSTYYMYASNATAQQIDRYTSSNGITWTLATSAVITVGAGGTWNDDVVQNNCTWIEAGTWYMILEGDGTPGGETYSLGLYTSSDGITWTQSGSNPVLTGLSQGGPFVTKVGSTYWMWAHGGTSSSVLPTQISRYYSTNLTSWTSQGLVFNRRQADEGPNTLYGQVGDPFYMERNGEVYMWYSSSTNGSAQTGGNQIQLAIIEGTFAQITAGTESDIAPIQGIPNVWLPTTGGVNYSVGKVGINQPLPTYKLDIVSTSASNDLIKVRNTNAAGQAGLAMLNDQGDTWANSITGSSVATYGALTARDGALYCTRNITIMSDFASGVIKFATGGNTKRWEMTSAGHFIGGADNTYDIGASGATRPRTGYFGTSIVAPTGTFATAVTVPTITVATKVNVTTGANKSIGVSGAMTAGTITISTTAVTSSSIIMLVHATVGGTQGILSVGTITNGTSFQINSSSVLDTGTVNWWIIN